MKIDLLLLPYRFTLDYWGLRPSACASYPEIVSAREVPAGNLLMLFLMQPWKSRTRILCLHWSTELYGSKFWIKSLFMLATNLAGLLALKLFNNVRFVWVLHNRYAHDYPHPLIDRIGRSLVERLADVIVAQQQQTEHEYKTKYPHKRIEYIPHVNFVGAYGPLVPKTDTLREEFALSSEDIVLLSFGAIRPYKKIEYVIDALAACAPELRNRIALVVAGKGSEPYIDMLKKRAGDMVRLFVREGFVPDDQVPILLSSASYAVFFFDESERTSGSLLVSLSYGLPVIARAIAGAECVDGTNGYTFSDTNGLKQILERLPVTVRPAPEAVAASVAAFSVEAVEQAYKALYESLILP